MKNTFEQWMREVDRVLEAKVGLSHGDLADQTWRDWHNSGLTPHEAAIQCLDAEAEEMGMESGIFD